MSDASQPARTASQPTGDSQRQIAEGLRDILALLNSSRPLGEVLDVAVSEVCRLLGSDSGLIYRLEQEGQVGHIQACCGLPDELCNFHFFPIIVGRSNQAISQRKHFVVDNYQEFLAQDIPDPTRLSSRQRDWVEGVGAHFKAQLGFPLVVRDNLFGGMLLFYHSAREFGEEDIRLGSILADHVAMVIENARLHEDAVRRADELQTLLTVQQAITSRLDPDDVLQMIAEQAQRLTGAQRAEVFLLDSSREKLVTTFISGSQAPEMVGRWLPVKDSLAGQSLMKGEPLLFTDVDNDPRLNENDKTSMLYKSQIGVPLLGVGGPLGMIGVGHREAGKMGKEEARVLAALASSAAIALENARLYSGEQDRRYEAERRRKVAEGMRDILDVLNSRRPFNEVLDYIVYQASQLLGANAGVIYHGVADRQKIVVEAASGAPEELLTLGEMPQVLEAANRALIDLQPYAVSDLDQEVSTDLPVDVETLDPTLIRWKQAIRKHYRAYLAVPLVIKDELYGALTLYYKDRRNFTPEDVDVGLSLGRQVALAIESARLTEESHRRTEELQSLFSVQQAIVSPLDPDEVLQMIADEARRLTGTQISLVYLLDDSSLEISVVSGDVPASMLGMRLPLEGSVAGEAVHERRPVLVADVANHAGVYHPIADPIEVRTFIVVPLLSAEKPIGTITVANHTPGTIKEDAGRVLTLLASSAVVAMENARLYHDEQERRKEADRRRAVAEGLRDILAVLNSDRPLADILQAIVAQACSLLNAGAGAIFRVHPNEDVLRVVASQGLPPGYAEKITIPLGQAAAGQAVSTRSPVAIADLALTYPDTDPVMVDLERRALLKSVIAIYRSLLAVPLLTHEETYGALLLYYPEKRDEFDEEELHLATAFADQAALAIENARLIMQVEETAAVAERSRLARDLHDAVTQTLFSASLIAEVLPRLWERNPQEGSRRLEELRQLTRGALAEMRTLLMELRPAALMEVSLDDLLRQLTEAFTGRTRVSVKLETEETPNLPAEVRVAFYRIAQEALNNVSKHAQASQVQITLHGDTNGASLRIRDNGLGFNLGEVPPEHLGLGIMRERADGILARLEISSQTGKGTQVSVTWPGRK